MLWISRGKLTFEMSRAPCLKPLLLCQEFSFECFPLFLDMKRPISCKVREYVSWKESGKHEDLKDWKYKIFCLDSCSFVSNRLFTFIQLFAKSLNSIYDLDDYRMEKLLLQFCWFDTVELMVSFGWGLVYKIHGPNTWLWMLWALRLLSLVL